MTSPNFENIDLWLFDYVEGNLSVYQKELLENYIRNHPELEIDLDMWNMSKMPVAETLDHGVQIKKKRENRYAYYTTSILGAVIILLIAKSNESYNLYLNKSIQTSDLQINKSKNEVSKETYELNTKNANSATVKIESSIILNEIQITQRFSDSGLTNVNPAPEQQEAMRSTHRNTIFSKASKYTPDTKEMIEERIDVLALNPLKLPIQLKGIVNSESYSSIELTQTSQASNKKSSGLNGIRLNTRTLFNKIDRVLSKSIAFSNYRDHFYMIPGIASNNINLSATGSTSQTRFLSTSRARWFGTSNEKLSQELSIDGYARSIRSGIGAQVNYDTYANGTIQDWNAALIFSPKIALSRNISLEPVARLKIGNKILDANKAENNSVSLYNHNNPQIFAFDTTQNIGRKLWYRDLDAGFTINTKVLYIGFQAENLLNHVENLYQNDQNSTNAIPTTYSLLAGTQYLSRNEKVSFHPYVYMRSNVNRTAYYTGFSFDLDKLFIGASYGSDDEYSGSLGLSLNRFALLVQTTRAYQPQLNQNLFTHQLTLRVNSPMSKKTRRYITL
ncbi:MAG: type IX secretion system membrane protein PorP/SprF [Crocinitomicaceae bacterium]